ncbi:signal recognition particle-docking protein FtsY [Buchnera aphidicola (Muscaphis stroyani)]|uniref:Signal recognition particle receptor FtsY n=1 Tax=Buchnera aphidicola (Muscaphis stroyani) TaxID=1241869 RepID=A0A4D6Y3H9_9GAMM|nr:signal recognition particle-docking protein FtsY [Buchnera aphidicola]QCI24146.1 signal recognition particle-docking protein FtsY [Buchnera aphidicola (Muscaphis stroyani)]
MKDNPKNSFFSWLTSKVKRKRTKNDIKSIKFKDKEKVESLSKNKLRVKEKDLDKISKTLDFFDAVKVHKNKNKFESIEESGKNLISIKDSSSLKKNFFINLKESLKKTKLFFDNKISCLFSSKKIDDSLFKELEEKLLLADIGINTTNFIIERLINDINEENLQSSEKIYFLLKNNMRSLLKNVEMPLKILKYQPFIILITGVNGVGKTTTAIKLAKKYKLEGKSVMLAAADTFRAAGIEQLKVLGKANNIPVIAQRSGSDPASVVFDAVKSSISKKIDILIIDTAGRLHNKLHLMEELKKIVRVIKKLDSSAPHEKILIIDACNGQNTINQTEIFHKSLNLTGLVITKLDGTAKGGVVFSLANQFSIPIRYIGIGEKTSDLGIFNSQDFINSIFYQE